MIDIINDLKSDIELTHANTLIVCGAGISGGLSGLPTGFNLTNNVLEYLEFEELPKEFTHTSELIAKSVGYKVDLFGYPRLEAIFDSISQVLDDKLYYEFIYHFLHQGAKDKIYSNFYHRAISEFIQNGGTVITFNYDKLIEVIEPKINVLVFPLKQRAKFNPHSGHLIKMHGCLSTPNSIGINFNTININGFPEDSLEKYHLDTVFNKIENIITIGYSFSDSFDFTPYLSSLKKKLNYFYFNYDSSSSNSFNLRNYKPELKDNYKTFEYVFNEKIIPTSNSKIFLVDFKQGCFQNIGYDESFKTLAYLNNAKPKFSLNDDRHKSLQYNLYDYFGLEYADKINKSKFLNIYEEIINSNSIDESLKFKFESGHINKKRNYFTHFLFHIKELFTSPRISWNLTRLFGTLDELVFLAQSKIERIIGLALIIMLYPLIMVIGGFTAIFKANSLEHLLCLRKIYLPLFRLSKTVYLKGRSPILYNPILRAIKPLIKRAERISKSINNMNEYRFTLKEKYLTNYFLSDSVNSKEQSKSKLKELICFNADTNYLIEVKNVIKYLDQIEKADNNR